MTIEEVYIRVLQKVNRNLGSNNIKLDKPRFILLYNKCQVDRIMQVYRKNDDRIREIQSFLKPNTQLTQSADTDIATTWELPDDYLEISNVYALADKGYCKGEKISLFEIKDKNFNEIAFDDFNSPSFEYRESSFIIADEKLNVFKSDDFNYTNVIMSYYRYPRKVDISGYVDLQGNSSTSINPEGDQDFIEKVIDLVALEFAKNNENASLTQFNLNNNN